MYIQGDTSPPHEKIKISWEISHLIKKNIRLAEKKNGINTKKTYLEKRKNRSEKFSFGQIDNTFSHKKKILSYKNLLIGKIKKLLRKIPVGLEKSMFSQKCY